MWFTTLFCNMMFTRLCYFKRRLVWSHWQWFVNRPNFGRFTRKSKWVLSARKDFSSLPTTLAQPCRLSKCSSSLHCFKFALEKTFSQSMRRWDFCKSLVLPMQVKPKRTQSSSHHRFFFDIMIKVISTSRLSELTKHFTRTTIHSNMKGSAHNCCI